MKTMVVVFVTCALLAQTDADKPSGNTDYLRNVYRADAEKYAFELAGGGPLKLLDKPIMRWANDDDWSGDVYLWARAGRPQVVGCVLSGPSTNAKRLVYHEFHLLGQEPIASADLLTRRRWTPKSGLTTRPIEGAPAPATTATARLTQMRQLAKEFTAHMQADGAWELRLLPQPLYRWGKEGTASTDGALFGFVWTKGTDLELILMFEARAGEDGPAWHYAPVRFSNRELWLKYAGQEIWRTESHREPSGNATDELYTTAYAATIPNQPLEPPAADNK
jgi:hypothetical protein